MTSNRSAIFSGMKYRPEAVADVVCCHLSKPCCDMAVSTSPSSSSAATRNIGIWEAAYTDHCLLKFYETIGRIP